MLAFVAPAVAPVDAVAFSNGVLTSAVRYGDSARVLECTRDGHVCIGRLGLDGAAHCDLAIRARRGADGAWTLRRIRTVGGDCA